MPTTYTEEVLIMFTWLSSERKAWYSSAFRSSKKKVSVQLDRCQMMQRYSCREEITIQLNAFYASCNPHLASFLHYITEYSLKWNLEDGRLSLWSSPIAATMFGISSMMAVDDIVSHNDRRNIKMILLLVIEDLHFQSQVTILNLTQQSENKCCSSLRGINTEICASRDCVS